MNQNTQTILNHIVTTLILKDENINADGSPNWNFLDADIHLDVDEGILDAELIGDDIDAAFDVVNATFKNINAAIDRVVV
jgi:ribosome-associated translation inhibitor RaiA